MPELEDVPILAELGEQLKAGFSRREARRRRTRGRLDIAAAGTAMAVAAVLAWGIGGGGFASSPASAASFLQQAARTVASQRYRFPKPHQFISVRWVDRVLLPIQASSSSPVLLPVHGAVVADALVTTGTWESWSATRSGEIVTRVLKVGFPTAAARARWVRLGRPRLFHNLVQHGVARIAPVGRSFPLGLTEREVLALPTDPHALYERLFVAGGSSPGDVRPLCPVRHAACVLSVVRILQLYPIGGRLHAAIYRALGLVPGIHLEGPARTLTGAAGEAVGTRDGAVEDELIINPRDGALLGARTVTIDPRSDGLPAGTIRSQTAIVQWSITNRPRPPGKR